MQETVSALASRGAACTVPVMPTPAPIPCRVCAAPSEAWFSRAAGGGREVLYFRCGACGHVQVERAPARPEPSAGSGADLGARCVRGARWAVALAWDAPIGPEEKVVDFSEGAGLVARLCRDAGLNAFHCERGGLNLFARGFAAGAPEVVGNVTLVTAFEVAQRFPQPVENWRELLDYRPELVLFSTPLLADHGPDWHYFADPLRSLAVYTRESLAILAARFGYQFQTDGELHLFLRPPDRAGLLRRVRLLTGWKCRRYRWRHGSRLERDLAAPAPR